jgi:hypothetical protein
MAVRIAAPQRTKCSPWTFGDGRRFAPWTLRRVSRWARTRPQSVGRAPLWKRSCSALRLRRQTRTALMVIGSVIRTRLLTHQRFSGRSRHSFDLDRAGLFRLCAIGVGRDDGMLHRAGLQRRRCGVSKLVANVCGDDDQPGCQPPWRMDEELPPHATRKEQSVGRSPVVSARSGVRRCLSHRAGLPRSG